jgi:muconate cycloisomerase
MGWGEGLARSFVTGESNENVFQAFETLPEALWSTSFSNLEESLDFLKRGPWRPNSTAVACALELAILDLLGKKFQKSVAALLGAQSRHFQYPVPVSGVLGLGWGLKQKIALHLMKAYGLKHFKIKVASDIDYEIHRLKQIRSSLGADGAMRLDANSSLTYEQAEQLIRNLKPLGVEWIEDPLKKEEWTALARLQKETAFPIVLDESVCGLQDAKSFCEEGSFAISVRMGKCGGWLSALELIRWCETHRIPYQIGCHVAETGLLSSAARQLLALSYRPLYVEGFYDRWLMQYQLTRPCFSFEWGGAFQIDTTPWGWGVEINEGILKRFAVEQVEAHQKHFVKS